MHWNSDNMSIKNWNIVILTDFILLSFHLDYFFSKPLIIIRCACLRVSDSVVVLIINTPPSLKVGSSCAFLMRLSLSLRLCRCVNHQHSSIPKGTLLVRLSLSLRFCCHYAAISSGALSNSQDSKGGNKRIHLIQNILHRFCRRFFKGLHIRLQPPSWTSPFFTTRQLVLQNLNRNNEEWLEKKREYPTYPYFLFHERFQMLFGLFRRILEAVVNRKEYFLKEREAVGKLVFSPFQKVTSDLPGSYKGALGLLHHYYIKHYAIMVSYCTITIHLILTDCTCGTLSCCSNLNYNAIEIVLQYNCIQLGLYLNYIQCLFIYMFPYMNFSTNFFPRNGIINTKGLQRLRSRKNVFINLRTLLIHSLHEPSR
ncbi:hypothetical protein VP01_3273g1 [Puccinia sorghi]|uniref:Uncharacterized protein n=1 Tax=Puccinia sorghi TaxID=27349 RepID=A0A0L6UYP3_9BASI|nr:hypothetical protein VP01_3273g1 [Puccinia sorghi]